jgi:membrane carboxypeptidase/penicillin-binding protein
MTPLVLLLLLTAFVGASVNVSANAKQRRQSTSTKKKKQSSTAKSVKSKRSTGKLSASKTTRRGKVSKRSVSEKKTTARGSQISSKQVQRLFRKRGKLTRNERAILNKYRSSRSRRARARYLARMRALRARDSALRNIAAGNILKDDTGGEDLEIRSAALNALNGRSGTVVVMDPNTGRILSIVNQKMALGSPVKPCSTVKMIVGLAALHEGVFDPNEDVKFSTNASMNLTDAVARSNNPVFQVLGRMLGFERLINYAGNYGFGEKTGVNYPNESTGFLPEDGEQETGHMSSHGDGFGVTAIQLAAFTGAIANGGYLYVPRVARSIEEANDFAPELKRRIVMSPEDRLRMMSGMIGAINYGTGKLAYNPLGQVAGKTGTCTGNRDKLGLFTSFSSVDDPKLVVTVITTGSTEAGRRAAEIAGRIYSAISPRYFRDRLSAPAAAGAEIPDGQDKNN